MESLRWTANLYAGNIRRVLPLVNDLYAGDTCSLVSRMEVLGGVAIVLAMDTLGFSDYIREASLGSGTLEEWDMDGVGEDRV